MMIPKKYLNHDVVKEFDIKTFRRLKYFIRIEVTHSKDNIFIS